MLKHVSANLPCPAPALPCPALPCPALPCPALSCALPLVSELNGVPFLWRQVYRPVAARGALMYFLVDALNALDRVYHYSMANFVLAMHKGAPLLPCPALSVPVVQLQLHGWLSGTSGWIILWQVDRYTCWRLRKACCSWEE